MEDESKDPVARYFSISHLALEYYLYIDYQKSVGFLCHHCCHSSSFLVLSSLPIEMYSLPQ